jgi:hypothetical protein
MRCHRRRPAISYTPIRKRRIDTLPFDEDVIMPVSSLLLAEHCLAEFRLPDADAHQIVVPDSDGAPAVTLTLWPSLRRVDALSPTLTVVFTGVVTVDLVEGVEVLFRRGNGDYLIVAIGGKVIVRA